MTDPDKTLEPRTTRTFLKNALEWAKERPAVVVPLLAFLAGLLLGKLL